MIQQTYEHHLELRQDKLCPFKFKECRDVFNSVCNWHHNIEILLVTAGEGRIQYGSDDFEISRHDVIVVNSELLHRVYSESGIDFTYVLIDESFCSENGIELNIRTFDRRIRSQALEDSYLKAQKCYDEYKSSPTPINVAKARCSTLSLAIELLENHTVKSVPSEHKYSASEQYVKKALEYIGDHYAEPIALERVAAECGITKYHLARVFKTCTGKTLFTHVNILRCRKAELCISAGMTVTEAARESGFESPSYFSRTYKKLMGKTPSSEK